MQAAVRANKENVSTKNLLDGGKEGEREAESPGGSWPAHQAEGERTGEGGIRGSQLRLEQLLVQ